MLETHKMDLKLFERLMKAQQLVIERQQKKIEELENANIRQGQDVITLQVDIDKLKVAVKDKYR